MSERDFDFSDLGPLFADVLGDSVRERRIFCLGHPGRRALSDPINALMGQDTDVPGMVWVHPLTVRIPGQAEDTSESPPRQALNEGRGKIRDEDLIYGLPVYVRKDGKIDVLDGPADYLAAEYLYKVKVRPQRSIDLGQFEVFLLKPTSPATRAAMFTGGYAVLDTQIYQIAPRLTTDLITAAGALSSGYAAAVQVSLDVETDTLYYTVGTAFAFNAATGLPNHATAWTTYYPKTLTGRRFLMGWVRIYYGMSQVTQNDILPAQELVGKAGGTTPVTSTIPVTYCGMSIWYDGSQIVYEV